MSNRADFLEMREQESFENPQDYERPEERKEKLPYRLDLHARSNDYIAAIKRRTYKAPLTDEEKSSIEKYSTEPAVYPDFDFHKDGQRDMTGRLINSTKAYDLIRKTSKRKCDESDYKNLKDGFKRLKSKSRSI